MRKNPEFQFGNDFGKNRLFFYRCPNLQSQLMVESFSLSIYHTADSTAVFSSLRAVTGK
jgi:hypothetical protein